MWVFFKYNDENDIPEQIIVEREEDLTETQRNLLFAQIVKDYENLPDSLKSDFLDFLGDKLQIL